MTTQNEQFFDQMIASIRSKLPIQNPLHSFVHNNILMMFENKDFHEAVAEAGALYRARPYWPEVKYIERYKEGKIIEQDIFDAIEHYLGNYNDFPFLEKMDLTSKEFLYRLMLGNFAFNSDNDAQPDIQDTQLWDNCQEKLVGQSLVLKRSCVKWRAKEYWEKYHNETLSLTIQPFMIRLISSYLDQGQSFWTNPFVNKGFWEFFCFDIEITERFALGWQRVLVEKVNSYRNQSSREVIQKELTNMGIPQDKWETILLDMLFDLKGWSGMVNKLELEPWQATVKSPQLKLLDYIAALLLLESSLDTFHAREHSIDLSMIYGREEKIEYHSFQLTLALYQITLGLKLDHRWMKKFKTEEILNIINEIDFAENIHRIRLWHEAYEHHFYREALQAIVNHRPASDLPQTPYAQVLFCIDDREESIRRHLEEIDRELITYGVVGFFGIDMKFSSLKSSRLIAQCPPVIVPSRVIKEIPKNQKDGSVFLKYNQMRGGSDLSLYYMSRTLFRGFLSTLFLGVASIPPMFLQVFFPKHSKMLKRGLFNLVTPEPETEMAIEQTTEGYGYSKTEMANIVETILRMCGFKEPYSPLVVLIGHGSSSNNNPFRQAYGCGACGGNAGVPNSRAFVKMANDPEVRVELKKLGLNIPDETYFVSGFHDTCTDEIHFFDLEQLPAKDMGDFTKLRKSLNEAAKLNAFERCQRFASFDQSKSADEALQHVRERAEDLAQPRPEYGHSTNSLAIVAKRNLTKGLFLNRRSFLITYDWQLDPDGKVLTQVVLGSIPVCVNINMDYYFSCVDNENFGCGSKLPLNLTSLLGVMTGSSSDLRIGLARQMVEIHEPIRNMTIIEAPLARVKAVFDGHPRLTKILYHHWMRLCVYDPEQKDWFLFGKDNFRPIKLDKSSLKHFKDSIDLIQKTHSEEDFAEIEP
ncbi:MAG: putative inorganic carbon transporter subunit DabA [Bacteriovoracaceae bacterium]